MVELSPRGSSASIRFAGRNDRMTFGALAVEAVAVMLKWDSWRAFHPGTHEADAHSVAGMRISHESVTFRDHIARLEALEVEA
jgi:hypothetical protein